MRKAIAHAIDRESIVKNIVGEGAQMLNTMCSPSQVGCTDEGATTYKYDPALAKKLLAEAGYPNGFDIDIVAYRERNQTEAIINYLQAVGIKAKLSFLQYAAMRDMVRANKAALTHQTWGSNLVNDVSASTPVYFGFGGDDITRDPEVRDLLDKGDHTIDPERAQRGLQEGPGHHCRTRLRRAAVVLAGLLRRQQRREFHALPRRAGAFLGNELEISSKTVENQAGSPAGSLSTEYDRQC